MKKWIGVGIVVVVLLACGGFELIKCRKDIRVADDRARLVEADSALHTRGDAQAALTLFRLSRSHSFPAGEVNAWFRIQRDALLSLDRIAELAGLYGLKPELIYESDEARLKLYDLFCKAGNTAEANRLFRDADPENPAWKIAQARSLMSRAIKPEVVSLLSQSSFEGKEEAERIYLLCAATTSPTARSAILEKVDKKLLNNPFVRLARARHFEANEMRREAAYELSMALQSSTDKIPHIHDAAGFFLRNRSSHAALQLWSKYAEVDALSWVRIACWSKFVRPSELPKSPPAAKHHLKPVIKMLGQLPAKEFFPLSAGTPWHQIAPLQEVLWLQWLAELDAGNEQKAFEMLREFPEPDKCFNPLLGRLAYMVLNYRIHNQFSALGCRIKPPRQDLSILKQMAALEKLAQQRSKDEGHPSLTDLVAGTEDAELITLATLLDGPFAIPLVLLLAGWEEAALRLAKGTVPSPGDAALNMRWAQALQRCRGHEEALAFLSSLPPSPAGEIAQAETLIALQRTSEATILLRKHLGRKDRVGSQSAWLLANLQFVAKNYNDALRTLLSNRDLALSIVGHELAGQIYLADDDEEKADDVFRRILPHSPLAQDFVATQAYRKGDLKTAAELRGRLAMRFPDRPDFRAHAARLFSELNPQPQP